MIVTFSGQQFPCAKAVKNGDSAFLYLEDGGTVELRGISDWSVFLLDGGDWVAPEPTQAERLRADVDFLAAMTGVSL